jgi:hypothetical protein
VVSGVVVGAGVLVEGAVDEHVPGADEHLVFERNDGVCPAAHWRRDFLVSGRAGRRPAMRRKRAPR